jgi:hypothetical protein
MTSVSTLAPVPGLPPASLKKRTLIKDQCGQSRTTSYVLPTEGHAYGLVLPTDDFGAGDTISKWVGAAPSQPKMSQRSFVKTNIMALKEGAITSAQQRKFAEEHPDIRFKQVYGKILEAPPIPFKGPYGVPSGDMEAVEGNTKLLIEAKFTDFQEEKDYPEISRKATKGSFPMPRATKASLGKNVKNAKKSSKKDLSHFKMKKFENIPGKVHNQ